jgi:hypothetical protein
VSLQLYTWWLSYADIRGPRGVCIVRETSFLAAVAEARRLGISPGGQCRGHAAPPKFEAELESHLGKYLTNEQAMSIGGRPSSTGEEPS